MLINELSKRSGLSQHTIRFYEKSGLLRGRPNPEVKTNQYNHYDEDAVERLALIQDAKSIGFSIREIAQLLDAWYSNQLNKKEKLQILDDRIQLIEEKIEQLKEVRQRIEEFKISVSEENC